MTSTTVSSQSRDAPAPPVADIDVHLVLENNRRRLFGIAFTILRDHGEAEDCVQETLERAWLRWDDVRDPAARTSWLTRICVNAAINRKRRRRWGPIPLPSDHHAKTHPRAAGVLIDLDRAYLKLPLRQRAALLLHVHHGYTLDECGELLGCSPSTVRTHIARAAARLQKELNDDQA